MRPSAPSRPSARSSPTRIHHQPPRHIPPNRRRQPPLPSRRRPPLPRRRRRRRSLRHRPWPRRRPPSPRWHRRRRSLRRPPTPRRLTSRNRWSMMYRATGRPRRSIMKNPKSAGKSRPPVPSCELDERFRAERTATVEAALGGPGATTPELRHSVARGEPPAELATLVETIRRHAYRVTDEDLDALRDRYTEDQLFEVIVAAAIGAAEQRLRAAQRVLEEA